MRSVQFFLTTKGEGYGRISPPNFGGVPEGRGGLYKLTMNN